MSKLEILVDSTSFKSMEQVDEREAFLESLGFEGSLPHDDGSSYQRYFSIDSEKLIKRIKQLSEPMTDSEVLETCIQRAIDGGWLGTQECTHLQWLEAIKEDSKQKWFEKDIYYMVIYNHEFAKSLWGDEFKYFVARDGRGTAVGEIEYVTYKHHLQQMVISEDPIDYLRKWLDSRLAEQ